MNDKFNNDYESLLKSYSELEKEFTKKCQQISELQKTIAEHQSASGTNADASPQTDRKEAFFALFPEAEQYRCELQQRASDPMYEEKPDAFFILYIDLLKQQTTLAEQNLFDLEFLQQHFLEHAELFQNLLQQLNKQKEQSVPVVTICGNSGDMSVSMPTRPKTISEASELAKKYFK